MLHFFQSDNSESNSVLFKLLLVLEDTNKYLILIVKRDYFVKLLS